MLLINEITRLFLGVQGENNARTITIDVSEWLKAYPNGNVTIWSKRNGEHSDYTPTGIEFDRTKQTISWTPSGVDTFYAGNGWCGIVLSENGLVRKSKDIETFVTESESAIPGANANMFDYDRANNKPKINNVELEGNQTLRDLGCFDDTNMASSVKAISASKAKEQLDLKIDKTSIVNGLTETGTGKVLDARQGKELKEYIDEEDNLKIDKASIVNGLTETGTGKVLDARQGKVLKDEVDLKVFKSDVVNTLTETGEGKVLDARQGKALNDAKIDKASIVNGLSETGEGKVLDARQGKALNDGKIDKTSIANNLNETAAGKVLDARLGTEIKNKIALPGTDIPIFCVPVSDGEGHVNWIRFGEEEIDAYLDDWTEENLDPDHVATIDRSLTSSSAAAGAMETGESILSALSTIAPEYDYGIFPVSVGDYCHRRFYRGPDASPAYKLYKANTAVSTYESFNSLHWDEATVGEVLKSLADKMGDVPSGKTLQGQIGSTTLPTTAQTLTGAIAEHETDLAGKVPTTRTVNSKALSSDITVMGSDIPMNSSDNTKVDEAIGGLKSAFTHITDHTRNLFDPAYIFHDAYLDSSGKVVAQSGCASIAFPCEGSKTYTYKNFLRTGTIRQAFFTSMPTVGATGSNAITASNTNTVTSTTNANTTYIFLWIYNNAGESYTLDQVINACQIELGNQASDYIYPFTAQDLTARKAVEDVDGRVDTIESDIETIEGDVEDIDHYVDNKFEIAGNSLQIFNKDNYLFEWVYVLTGGALITSDRSCTLTVEVNAHAGDGFVWQFFNNISLNGSEGLQGFTAYTSNAVPANGGTALEYGFNPDYPNKRGLATLTQNAKYFNVLFLFDTKAHAEQYKDTMVNSFLLKYGADYSSRYVGYVLTVTESIDKHTGEGGNYWQGKKIWWCGTSIPEGRDTSIGSEGSGLSYPALIGQILGATVYNESLGASMCRANVRTGDYVHGKASNVIRALMATTEEKQNLITNWSTIRQVLDDPNTYPTLDETQQAVALGATFEQRLMPYLNGTKPMPDLFVIDHGHNDWKSFYTMPDGTTPDTELKPTVENITNNVLAEDTYMTANNNAKLISFFTEISNIPSAKRAQFIASVNRNCFIGAVNFLCTLILSKNPRARILFIGNLDNWEKPQVQPAQEYLAGSWDFNLIKMWEYLGFSGHYIPNTATYWDDEGTTDLTVKEIYCKDGVHPHSDTTGESIEIYAHTIANILKDIR